MDRAGFQPSLRDLCPSKLAHPTLKRCAILGHPSGMRRVKSSWHWTAKYVAAHGGANGQALRFSFGGLQVSSCLFVLCFGLLGCEAVLFELICAGNVTGRELLDVRELRWRGGSESRAGFHSKSN